MKNATTQNRYNLHTLLFIFTFCLTSFFGNAQEMNISIPWKSSIEVQKGEEIFTVPAIEGNEFEHSIPIYSKMTTVKKGRYSFQISQVQFENSRSEDARLVKDVNFEIPTTPQIETVIKQAANEYYLSVKVIPYVSVNGELKRIKSLTVTATYDGPLQMSYEKDYVSSSVLSSGDWYKIEVSNDGVYKLDKSFFESIGIDVSTLNPSSVNIYGNSFGKLSENNNGKYTDDLIKNSIVAVGENDGVFNEDDYFLFFGAGPNRWDYSPVFGFSREQHIYSSTSHYFIHIDQSDIPLRISTLNDSGLPSNFTITDYNYYDIHELENVSLVKGGQRWYGELFDSELSQVINFSVPNVVTNEPIRVEYAVGSKSTSSGNKFNVIYNGNPVDTMLLSSAGDDYSRNVGSFSFLPVNSAIGLNLVLNRTNPSVRSYLDYIKISGKRGLVYANQLFRFRDVNSVGIGNTAKYSISTNNQPVVVWDITARTNPKLIATTSNGALMEFTQSTDSLREYIAFTPNNYLVPKFISRVENQDIHALAPTDYLIVTHPNFIGQAERLANLHRAEGMNVHVVTTEQIYNEFSSGDVDATAIRRFTKMFYDRALLAGIDPPKHLLLFGDATYDPKNRVGGNNYFVPTYEVIYSENVVSALVTDDYFGLLDNNESINGSDLMDISVGRLLISTNQQAVEQVNKIEHYMKNGSTLFGNTGPNSCCSQEDNTTWGDWRNNYTLISDDEENGHFITSNGEPLVNIAQNSSPEMNYDKIYSDAYQQTSTAGGERYPQVYDAITEKVERGSLVVNYIGHGGEVGAAEERIITIPQILSWNNINRLGLFVTATCEFTKFDDPSRVSAGEWVSLNPTGGAIALMTTTRSVYIGVNDVILNSLYSHLFDRDATGMPLSYGEIMRKTKNSSGTSDNRRSFNLIGDPALTIDLPRYRIVTDSINHLDPTIQMDTIRALSKMSVSGHVEDFSGNILTNFNGILSPTIYDKPKSNVTLQNDPSSPLISFKTQKNALFKGKSTIQNGRFSFEFVVPKDINYTYGKGKISLYGNSTSTDANGMDTTFVVGGLDVNAPVDNVGPEISVYLNDDQFVNGGITSQEPLLVVAASDDFGINTVGNGIGHDLTAVLDGNTAEPIVLNEYYVADLDSYKSGKAQYTISGLSVGKHTLEVKVWDVNNNSSIVKLDFEVVADESVALDHVLNYPNPFTTSTTFFYEHNQSCSSLNTQIQIYTVSGRLVKTINENVATAGFRVTGIQWDGKDEFGDQLAKGVYVYRLTVELPDGNKAQKLEKLVLLK